jgi:SAM-dependent methyltransferase
VGLAYHKARQSVNHKYFKQQLWDYFFSGKDFLKKDNIAVLEPMCGFIEGKDLVDRYISKKYSYEGFDYSDNVITLAKELYPSLDLYQMDATRFLSEKKYDLVILIGTLHHIPDFAGDFLSKINRVLNSNGVLINFEPTYNICLVKLLREHIYRKNKMFDYETERAFILEELNGLFLESGFEILDQIYPGLVSYVLYYNPEAFPSLNIGSLFTVRAIFTFDRMFFRNIIGRKFSFATMSLLRKNRTV